jgi:ATP-dependent DNA helicase DinG
MEKDDLSGFESSLNFVAIDIETTGLDPNSDEIIELAATQFKSGKIEDHFSTLVRPQRGMPKYIEFLTHIKPEDLTNAPEAKSALRDFFSFVGDAILVGHNIPFDLAFINYHSALNNGPVLNNKFWDTQEISRVYFPFVSDHKLSTMLKFFHIEPETAHRASADAEASGLLLIAMTEHIIKHHSMMTNARLLDLSKQAQLENSLYNYLHLLVEYQRSYVLKGKQTQALDYAKPNVIENDVPFNNILLDEVFNSEGLLSQKFPHYEFRSGQLEMANKVEEAFQASKHLAIEAGTGVGKSFAYLVPAIIFAHKNKTRVVVSTNTKNLQDQLFYKDLPQLKQMLPLPFKASLVKGRENYVCERRWNDILMEQSNALTPYEAQALLYLYIWKQLTKSGDISENSSFNRKRFNIIWKKICSDRYQCMGRKCPYAGKCYVLNLRKHLENSSVVVTNHSLLLTDLRMENSTLGKYDYLVIDEAHNLMDSASNNLGFELGYQDLVNLFNQFAPATKRKNLGFLNQLEFMLKRSVIPQTSNEQIQLLNKNISEQISSMRKVSLELFTEAQDLCQKADSYSKLRIKNTADFPHIYELLGTLNNSWHSFLKQLSILADAFSLLNSKQVPNYDILNESLIGLIKRCVDIQSCLDILEYPDLMNNALWIENDFRPEYKTPLSTFCYAPVDVSIQLNEMLYENIPSIIFTSATLALRRSFKYFFSQSGLDLVPTAKMKEYIVDSPFDYDKQSLLMISSFLPEPKDRFFINQALGCIKELVLSIDVGTMILFTNYRDLNSVYDYLNESLYHRKRPLFAQGKSYSRSSMLEEFKSYKNAVLLGTNSFWEGVDIQGDSLSMLILFKLPFQVPSEPIVEALIDKLEAEQKDSFMHYMLPNALLKLRQGFGRLIRSKEDRGIVLIMDSRVSNKRYGKYFKEVLPAKCLEMQSELELLNEVIRFFNVS